MAKTKSGQKAEKEAAKLAGANLPADKAVKEEAVELTAAEKKALAKAEKEAAQLEKPVSVGKFYLHEASGRVVNEFGQFVSPECDLSKDVNGTKRLELSTLVKRFNRARGWK